MNKFTLTHEINCNAETFWKTFVDKDFNERLYLGELGFPAYKLIELTETETEIRRKVSGQPKMEMPGPIVKLLGSNFGYVEEGRFDRKTQLWTWKTTPSTMADKLNMTGNVRVEAIGDAKVRRFAETSIEAKVFGLGGLIESSTEKQMRDAWGKSAVFMNTWLAGAGR